MTWYWRSKRTPRWIPTHAQAIEHMATYRIGDRWRSITPGEEVLLDELSGLTIKRGGDTDEPTKRSTSRVRAQGVFRFADCGAVESVEAAERGEEGEGDS